MPEAIYHPPPDDPLRSLIQKAAATSYCRPALRELANTLPVDDGLITEALHLAAEARDARAFSHLYAAALYGKRHIRADVLAMGAPLLPEYLLLLYTALRLDGEVAEALTTAVRSERMGCERNGTAILVCWLDYERRGIVPPKDFQTTARRACRTLTRFRHSIIASLLIPAASLAGDPLVGRILGMERMDAAEIEDSLSLLRAYATGADWDRMIPAHADAGLVIGAGATVTRAIPKAGRNDPCPCGSGRKFKQCCAGKLTTGEQYAVDGVPIAAATARPELILTPQRVDAMPMHELYALDPAHIPCLLAGSVADRLARFREIERARQVLEAAGPEVISPADLESIAFELLFARETRTLRWLMDWMPPGTVEPSLEIDLLLADPAERLEMLQIKANKAFEEPEGGITANLAFADLAAGAMLVDPALGILISRAVLPVCGQLNQEAILDDIEEARDLLGLPGHDPAHDMLDAQWDGVQETKEPDREIKAAIKEAAEQTARSDAKIKGLENRVEALRQELVRREASLARKTEAASTRISPPGTDPAEIRELRDELRRLKENLKVEHAELLKTARELEAVQEQTRRAASRARTAPRTEDDVAGPPAANGDAPDSSARSERERQPIRVPEYTTDFCEALRHHPRPAAASALALAGRLAGGDPAAWHLIKPLRMSPGTFRARVAGDYRLLFQTGPGDSLKLLDLILRRDLEKWIGGKGI